MKVSTTSDTSNHFKTHAGFAFDVGDSGRTENLLLVHLEGALSTCMCVGDRADGKASPSSAGTSGGGGGGGHALAITLGVLGAVVLVLAIGEYPRCSAGPFRPPWTLDLLRVTLDLAWMILTSL